MSASMAFFAFAIHPQPCPPQSRQPQCACHDQRNRSKVHPCAIRGRGARHLPTLMLRNDDEDPPSSDPEKFAALMKRASRNTCPGQIIPVLDGRGAVRCGASGAWRASLSCGRQASLSVGRTTSPLAFTRTRRIWWNGWRRKCAPYEVVPEIEAFDLSHYLASHPSTTSNGKNCFGAGCNVQSSMAFKNAMPPTRNVFDFYVGTDEGAGPRGRLSSLPQNRAT